MLKSISLKYSDGKEYLFDFKAHKSLILYGTHALDILYSLESILTAELSNNISVKDKVYKINYSNISDIYLQFMNDSFMIMTSGTLIKRGNIPQVHVIRYSGNGNIRSYDFTARNVASKIQYNLFEYSSVMSETQWLRLISVVNMYLDFKFVDLVDNELRFTLDDSKGYNLEECKFVYMLFGELFLTRGMDQIVLLSDIEFMTKEHQVKLISYLSSILRVNSVVSTMNIDYTDISKTNNIPVVNT